jgi:hypothetical protein
MYLLCQRVLRHVSALWLKTAHCFPHTHEQGTCPVYWSCNRWLTHISCVSTCATVQGNRMSLMFLPCACTILHFITQETTKKMCPQWMMCWAWSTGNTIEMKHLIACKRWSSTTQLKHLPCEIYLLQELQGTRWHNLLKITLRDVKNLGWQCQKSQ